MTHGPMLYVAKGPDGIYRDRHARVAIVRDTQHPIWWVTVRGIDTPHPTLTDARMAAHRATKEAA